MRPLQDLIEDRTFVIARLRELLEDVRVLPGYYNQAKPLGMLFLREQRKILQIYDSPSSSRKGGHLLVVHKYGDYPPDSVIFEVLSQIEKENILHGNHRPANAEKSYSLFRVCYQ